MSIQMSRMGQSCQNRATGRPSGKIGTQRSRQSTSPSERKRSHTNIHNAPREAENTGAQTVRREGQSRVAFPSCGPLGNVYQKPVFYFQNPKKRRTIFVGHGPNEIKSKSQRLPRSSCTEWPTSTRPYTRWPHSESQECCLPLTHLSPRKKDHSGNLASPPPTSFYVWAPG